MRDTFVALGVQCSSHGFENLNLFVNTGIEIQVSIKYEDSYSLDDASYKDERHYDRCSLSTNTSNKGVCCPAVRWKSMKRYVSIRTDQLHVAFLPFFELIK